MSNSIEIFENTLLQLITRQGTNIDRQNVVLKSGELGYSTDTKRLFIGDGSTYGGNVVGNTFKGVTSNLTSLGSCVYGDTAFHSDENSLYTVVGGDGTNITNWLKIGAGYIAGNGSIYISPDNKISVSSLSAGTLSRDLMGQSIQLNSTNRLTLSSTIATNSIIPQQNSQYLNLPQFLSINSNRYKWPSGGIGTNKYLKTDAFGTLSWSNLESNVSYFAYNTGGILPVGTVISTLTSTNVGAEWILCDGRSLIGADYLELSAVIGTRYGGNSTNFNVPNLTNDILYGTDGNPYNYTTYPLASGISTTMSRLSGVGVNFFIKAKPDRVINGTFKVNSPLNITVNGTNRNNTTIPLLTSLASNLEISLPTSNIKVNSPLALTKNSTVVTDTSVSIFDGTLNIDAPANKLKVNAPLKLTVDDDDKTGQNVSPYVGDLNLTLDTKNTLKVNAPASLTVNGVDKTSQIINLDTPNQNIVIDVSINSIISTIYPIGSIVFSIDSINPKDRFGGNWVQISQGRFIVGVGSGNDGIQNKAFTAGNNSGEYEHKLTISEMPQHTHSLQVIAGSDGDEGNDSIIKARNGSGATGAAGGNDYHNNIPPGFGMYIWQRTA